VGVVGGKRQGLASSAKKGKNLGHCGCNKKREVHWKRGATETGSATDGAMPAARLKMATAIEARIVSNIIKVVEIWLRGLGRKKRTTMGGNQHLLEKERESNR
jgi:hypothetical protein